MSTIAARRGSDAQARVARLAVSRDLVCTAALALLVVALAAYSWTTWGDVGSDTGYDLVAGARVAHGQLPYVDFTYYYGPLAPALLGLVYAVFGVGVAAAAGLGIFLTTSIIAATYVLARSFVRPSGAFAAAALTAAVAFESNNLSFVLPYSESTTLAILLTLLTLIALDRFIRTGADRAALGAGLGLGLVSLTRPEFALAAILAAAVVMWLRARAGQLGRRRLVLIAGPAIAIPAAVYVPFAAATSLHRLLFSNLYPVHELRAGGSHIVRLQAPLTVASLGPVLEKVAVYSIGIGSLIVLARVLGSRRRQVGLVVAVAAAFILPAAAVVRPEAMRHGLEFVYGWIPVGALVAVALLARRALKDRNLSHADQAALAVAVVLAVLAAKTYAAFLFFAPSPQYAVFAAPFAAIFLARVHLVDLARTREARALGLAWLVFLAAAGLGLAAKDAHAKGGRISGPGGTLAVPAAQAAMYQGALQWIERETRPGEPILLAPQLTSLYVISARSDPLKQIALLPIVLPRTEDQRSAEAALTSAGVRLAIIDRRAFPEYGHSVFGASFDRDLARWLHARFTRVAVLGAKADGRTLEVWLRRAT